mmetsp:Transcript_23539/g.61940  ORF Transcript_23539/g.61940 Transcript_23539/m.61940 type:complete len:223 (+) Transcript_23539:422-1090(+)
MQLQPVLKPKLASYLEQLVCRGSLVCKVVYAMQRPIHGGGGCSGCNPCVARMPSLRLPLAPRTCFCCIVVECLQQKSTRVASTDLEATNWLHESNEAVQQGAHVFAAHVQCIERGYGFEPLRIEGSTTAAHGVISIISVNISKLSDIEHKIYQFGVCVPWHLQRAHEFAHLVLCRTQVPHAAIAFLFKTGDEETHVQTPQQTTHRHSIRQPHHGQPQQDNTS